MRPGCHSGQDHAGPRWVGTAGPGTVPFSSLACIGIRVRVRVRAGGAGRLQFHSEFHPQPNFGCNSWLFLAARRGPLGGCPGGEAREVPTAAWLGVSPAQSLCPASCKPGPSQSRPPLRTTLVSALGPGSHRPGFFLPWCGRSEFHKKAGPMLAVLSLIEESFMQQGRATWDPPPPPFPRLLLLPFLLPPMVTSSPAAPAGGCPLSRGS